MNKKDIEKLKEIAMAKNVSLSKIITEFLKQKIQLLTSWIFCFCLFDIIQLYLKL